MIDGSVPIGGTLCFMVILTGGSLLLTIIAQAWHQPSIGRLAVASMLGHAVVGLLLLAYGISDDSDATGYHLSALEIVRSLEAHTDAPQLSAGKEGWPWVLAFVYLVGGPVPALGVAINAVALGALTLVVYKTALLVVHHETAFRTSLLVFLSPGLWLWGSTPLREAIVALSIAIYMFGLVSIVIGGNSKGAWAALLFGTIFTTFFRGSISPIMVSALAVTILAGGIKRSSKGGRFSLLAVGVTVALGLAAQSALLAHSGSLDSERASDIRSSQARKGTTVISGIQGETGQSVLAHGVSVLPDVTLRPWPQELLGLPLLAPMAFYWWLIVFLALKGSRATLGRRLLLPTGTFALGLLMALAVFSGNFGTMIRLREQLVIVLLPLAALGLSRIQSQPHRSPPALRAVGTSL